MYARLSVSITPRPLSAQEPGRSGGKRPTSCQKSSRSCGRGRPRKKQTRGSGETPPEREGPEQEVENTNAKAAEVPIPAREETAAKTGRVSCCPEAVDFCAGGAFKHGDHRCRSSTSTSTTPAIFCTSFRSAFCNFWYPVNTSCRCCVIVCRPARATATNWQRSSNEHRRAVCCRCRSSCACARKCGAPAAEGSRSIQAEANCPSGGLRRHGF